MWIRSKSKISLVNANEIWIVDSEVRANNVSLSDGYLRIGTYKSKERAIEVLDEIQIFIKDYEYTRGGFDAKNFVVFEMPQE